MRTPCAANLSTARELLEHGVVDEGAKALVDLRRCAVDCGCEDWRDCNCQIEDTWRDVAHPSASASGPPDPATTPAETPGGRQRR